MFTGKTPFNDSTEYMIYERIKKRDLKFPKVNFGFGDNFLGYKSYCKRFNRKITCIQL